MLAFDIETIPQEGALAAPYNPDDHTPPANYKNADAIERWHATNEEKWRAERVKQCSLSPRLGQVVAISYASDNGYRAVDIAREMTEYEVLTDFWSALRHAESGSASFNGKSFDLPFIIARSAILGVQPRMDVSRLLSRYIHVPHFDVMLALGGPNKGDNLSAWCEAFGIPGKLGDGSQVYDLVQAGDWTKLAAYAQADADATLALAVRLAPFYGVECAEMVPALA